MTLYEELLALYVRLGFSQHVAIDLAERALDVVERRAEWKP